MTTKQKKALQRVLIAGVMTVALMIADKFIEIPMILSILLYLVPYLIIGFDVLKKAGKGILKKQVFDENFLMAVATIGAFGLGEFAEAVAVMLFYQVGELFESIAVGKSRQNIADLMDIRPDHANVLRDGKVEKVDPDEVEIGTELVVNPGERVPIDGIIIEGTTTLDTSALTGESVPRTAGNGDEILSGCINMSGLIHMKTTKEAGESTASKILELVEESALKKSKAENFITVFARYYTPIVCYSAVALAVLPPIISLIMGNSANFGQWLIRALSFLVISCPCALVISVPLSFFGGIGCASSQGILVKGSNYLEALSRAKYVVFDKTGTLTKGVFEVTKIAPENGFTKEELLEISALAEHASSHPIALSLKKAYEKTPDTGRIENMEELSGKGIHAVIDGKETLVGNKKLLEAYNVTNLSEISKDEVGSIVYVAINNLYAGHILISDTIKEQSPEALKMLKSEGIKQTVMLSGDRKETADAIGRKLGIDRVESELLPADKVTKLEELLSKKAEKENLVFVGDGLNDAPVLTRADIGVAMGALGVDAAIEAADVVLMDDNPKKIALAMKISRRTLWIVKENIAFALLVKIACLFLGAIGLVNMWIAIFADVGVMVIAVINATRALKIRA